MNQITRGDPIGPQRCVDALRGIASTSSVERRDRADAVECWHQDGEIDLHETRILSAVLGWAAVIETEVEVIGGRYQKCARTSLLDALSFFAEAGNAPLDVLEAVSAAITPPALRTYELDFTESIKTEIARLRAEQPHTPPPDGPARASIGPEHAILLVRGITSVWPFPRGQAAQAVTELCGAGQLDRREGDTLSGVLVWAAIVETEVPEIRGSLLDALGALARAGLVSPDTRAHLAAALAPTDLHPTERAAYDSITIGA